MPFSIITIQIYDPINSVQKRIFLLVIAISCLFDNSHPPSALPGGSDGKKSACNVGDSGSIPGLERSLEKGMVTHSSVLAWRILWTEEPGGATVHPGCKEPYMTERLTLSVLGFHGSSAGSESTCNGKIPWKRDRLPTPVFLGFPGGSAVKNLPAIRETWVQSLGWEDPLEESMTTHSSILPWKIPMDRGAWWAAVHEVAESGTTGRLSISSLA